MGIHQNEIAELVQRYLKEAHSRDMELKEILQQPWHKVVGLSWRAKAHFKEPGWYNSLDEVPDPRPDSYSIYIGDGKIKSFSKMRDIWVEQEVSEELYK